MPRLSCSRHGWGAVDDPKTGNLIQLDESHPADVCERVAAKYDRIEVVGLDGSEEREESEESEGYVCGVNDCSRNVDSPEATCWQH